MRKGIKPPYVLAALCQSQLHFQVNAINSQTSCLFLIENER